MEGAMVMVHGVVRLCVAAVVLAGASVCLAGGKVWDDSYYAKFDRTKFSVYKPANAKIDFKNVDQGLMGAAIFYETNRRRNIHRKRPLLFSPAVRKAALDHAENMVKYDFHGHENPRDKTKRTLRQRMALAGLTRCALSENVAHVPGRKYPIMERKPGKGKVKIDPNNIPAEHTYITFARQLLDGWMLSPGHKRNILSASTSYLGCAAVYSVQELLTRRGKILKLDYFKACQNFASKRGPTR
jgi:uncharacterized protein YkwD